MRMGFNLGLTQRGWLVGLGGFVNRILDRSNSPIYLRDGSAIFTRF